MSTTTTLQQELQQHLMACQMMPCKILSGGPGQPNCGYAVAYSMDKRTGLIEVLVKGGALHYYRPEQLKLINADIRFRDDNAMDELPENAIQATMDNFPKHDTMGLIYYLQLSPNKPFYSHTLHPFSEKVKDLIHKGKVWIDSPPKKRTYV